MTSKNATKTEINDTTVPRQSGDTATIVEDADKRIIIISDDDPKTSVAEKVKVFAKKNKKVGAIALGVAAVAIAAFLKHKSNSEQTIDEPEQTIATE